MAPFASVQQPNEFAVVLDQIRAELTHPHHVHHEAVEILRRPHYVVAVHRHGGSFFPICYCLRGLSALGPGCLTEAAAWVAPCPVEAEEIAAIERAVALGAL